MSDATVGLGGHRHVKRSPAGSQPQVQCRLSHNQVAKVAAVAEEEEEEREGVLEWQFGLVTWAKAAEVPLWAAADL